ncbi:MAG: FAD-binding oxidoreductase [Paracoccaceae bacterium]
MRVVIVGGGIIGAAIAWNLAQRGVQATVVEAGPVAGGASGRGFGWINASFHLNEAHYRLRLAAMEEWRRLMPALPEGAVNWPGTLWWEEEGDGFDAFRTQLRELGYPLEEIGRAGFQALEPGLAAAPERALLLPSEGAVELGVAVPALLAAAGARVLAGTRAVAIETSGDRVSGVMLEAGRLPAEAVVVAGGIGSAALVAPLGVRLPMLSRPGILMRTAPLPPAIRHILVAPGQELRQDAGGRILAPTAARHQCDVTETLVERPDALADQALARIRRMLPGVAMAWHEAVLAQRPVPGDGLPVMGAAGPEGLMLAVMHSGATLGALAGALVAGEVMGEAAALLAPYRPERFAGVAVG